jgi:tRNA A-37 threonylcarbamoyl transferase component Bud32
VKTRASPLIVDPPTRCRAAGSRTHGMRRLQRRLSTDRWRATPGPSRRSHNQELNRSTAGPECQNTRKPASSAAIRGSGRSDFQEVLFRSTGAALFPETASRLDLPVESHDRAVGVPTGSLLDRGFTSDVHFWGPGRVLKLFHQGTPRSKAENEFSVTQAVQSMGLPVPAVYEVVEVDGRPGIVMQRVSGVSLFHRVQARPWLLRSAVRELARLHARINSCPAPPILPAQRETIAAKVASASHLTGEEKQAVLNCLNDLPDGAALCHGDFHPGNILVTEKGPVIIDWDAATRGQPAGDAAYTLLLIQKASLPSWTPRYMHVLLAATRSAIGRGYLRAYVRSGLATGEQIKRWRPPVAAEVRRRVDRAVSRRQA